MIFNPPSDAPSSNRAIISSYAAAHSGSAVLSALWGISLASRPAPNSHLSMLRARMDTRVRISSRSRHDPAVAELSDPGAGEAEHFGEDLVGVLPEGGSGADRFSRVVPKLER